MIMRRIWLAGLCIVFIMLWSSGWTASHFAVSSSSALSILTVRYIIVLLVLLVLISMLNQWRHIPYRTIVAHLMIGALSHGLYLLGTISAFELGVSAAAVAFINSLQPVVTACCAGSLTGELTKPRQCKGLILGLLSAVLIVFRSYQSGVSVVALALPLIAMLALAMGTILNRRQAMKSNAAGEPSAPVLLLLTIHTTGALVVIMPPALFGGHLTWQFSTSEWKAIVWLALVVSLLAYAFMQLLVSQLTALQLASLAYLAPPVTMLQGYFLFDNAMSTTDVIAMCIAAGAVYFMATTPGKISSPRLSIVHSFSPGKATMTSSESCTNGKQ